MHRANLKWNQKHISNVESISIFNKRYDLFDNKFEFLD